MDVYFRKDGWKMNENQFFDELKTSLGQAIEYAKGNQSVARTKTVAIKELATFLHETSKVCVYR